MASDEQNGLLITTGIDGGTRCWQLDVCVSSRAPCLGWSIRPLDAYRPSIIYCPLRVLHALLSTPTTNEHATAPDTGFPRLQYGARSRGASVAESSSAVVHESSQIRAGSLLFLVLRDAERFAFPVSAFAWGRMGPSRLDQPASAAHTAPVETVGQVPAGAGGKSSLFVTVAPEDVDGAVRVWRVEVSGDRRHRPGEANVAEGSGGIRLVRRLFCARPDVAGRWSVAAALVDANGRLVVARKRMVCLLEERRPRGLVQSAEPLGSPDNNQGGRSVSRPWNQAVHDAMNEEEAVLVSGANRSVLETGKAEKVGKYHRTPENESFSPVTPSFVCRASGSFRM
ncbi:unnamed protein product [Protopolystoma xenopodis]|uniref:Uncharacterized protein n=1 Tax=Protopolystoma xenopodis TaxID=117903 RepID=A0A3S5AEE3_9PLAT|nr:unnamed protein product [Protopolystoma xenopodis]